MSVSIKQPVVQVLIGAVSVALLFLISRLVVNPQESAYPGDPTKSVTIVKGIADGRQLHRRSFPTAPTSASPSNFIALPPTVNRYGGSQMCFTWWMKLNNVDDSNIAGKVLFMRGDEREYPLQKFDISSGSSQLSSDYTTRIVKAPLVRFGSSYKELIIECNTTDDLEQAFASMESGKSRQHRDYLNMLPGRWVMWTFVLEDNVPVDDFEAGIVMRLYLNDTLFVRKTAKGALRLNEGSIHLCPNSDMIQGLEVSNLTFVPWAMSDRDIQKRFRQGVRPKGGRGMCSADSTGLGDGQILMLPTDAP
jgi:hypothetical protein